MADLSQASNALLFASLNLGSAHTGCFSNLNARQGGPEGASTASNPYVLRVRAGCSALSASKLTATITPDVPALNYAGSQHEKDAHRQAKSRSVATRLSPAPCRGGGG